MTIRYLGYLSVLIFIILIGCAIKQEKKYEFLPIKINIIQADFKIMDGIVNVNHQPFSGTIYLLYPNAIDTSEVRNYLRGVENGEWRKYYSGGKLREKRSFINGQKTGHYIVWWQNGTPQQDYLFDKDVYQGTCREWSETGILIKEMNYNKGYEEGTQRAWWDNGKVKSNYIIKEARRFGLLGTKNCINVSDSIFK